MIRKLKAGGVGQVGRHALSPVKETVLNFDLENVKHKVAVAEGVQIKKPLVHQKIVRLMLKSLGFFHLI